MKVAIDLDVQIKDGILILDAGPNCTLIIPPEHVVSKKIHMVTLAELTNLSIKETCNLFGYRTRIRFENVRVNIGPTPETFEFHPHAGVEVIDLSQSR